MTNALAWFAMTVPWAATFLMVFAAAGSRWARRLIGWPEVAPGPRTPMNSTPNEPYRAAPPSCMRCPACGAALVVNIPETMWEAS